MTETSARHRFTLVAGIACLAGPSVAALSELGHLRFFESLPGLWGVAAIGAIAAFGVGIGVLSIYRGAKVAGVVCLLTNAPVLAVYGFIVVFFARGGTR